MDSPAISNESLIVDDDFVNYLLSISEDMRFEFKRVAGDKLTRALETVVAFANTDGGNLILGVEDEAKAKGRDRVYGVDENPLAVDEIQRLIANRITPKIPQPTMFEIGATLRDGAVGRISILNIEKSDSVHSIIADGTWQRLTKGNKELVADEITQLSLERGKITAESRLVDVDFDLLRTSWWDQYVVRRQLTRELPDALHHLGLAAIDAQGVLRPSLAAVLLFAEEPSGLLKSKSTIRIFHYQGDHVEHGATPNLLKPPKSISGPLVVQIANAYQSVINELASGVQMGPFGFEIAQKYPTRVIKEAITNAVIHRDYSLPSDIHVRIFSDRIEVISPGVLPGKITAQNIRSAGSYSRNPLIITNLREFPEPPNLDAGEGVRMMFQTMSSAGLYPPTYLSRATTGRDEVRVILRNDNRPNAWDQVSAFLDQHGSIANAEVRQITGQDTLAASKSLKGWVNRGLLEVANPRAGKRTRRYKLPEVDPARELFASGKRKQKLKNL